MTPDQKLTYDLRLVCECSGLTNMEVLDVLGRMWIDIIRPPAEIKKDEQP